MYCYSGPHYFHQLGSSDHVRCLTVLREGHGAGAIISPKDFVRYPYRLKETVEGFKSTGAQVLIDPQGYDPSTNVGEKETNLEGSAVFHDTGISEAYIDKHFRFQHEFGVTQFLTPCPETDSLGDDWQQAVSILSETGRTWLLDSGIANPLLSTIAVHGHMVRDPGRRSELLNFISDLKGVVDGIYLILGSVDAFTREVPLLIGILQVIFRLKWQGFNVLLGYCGPWAMLAFPFGLDSFANSGLKNRQSFTPWRGEQPRGWGPPGGKQYHDLYSPDLLGFVRYPDDVSQLSLSQKQTIFRRSTSYSPPETIDPSIVHASRLWRRGHSYQDFSCKMAALAREFQDLAREERIDSVRQKLSMAQTGHSSIGATLNTNRGGYIPAWREAFETYLEQETDLGYLFD
jgi:hypothetical protein